MLCMYIRASFMCACNHARVHAWVCVWVGGRSRRVPEGLMAGAAAHPEGRKHIPLPLASGPSMALVRGHAIEFGYSYRELITQGTGGHFSVQRQDCAYYVQVLEVRIRRDLALFRGAFTQYDLFNELIETPSLLRACGLFNTTLPAMFKLAASIDPTAQLVRSRDRRARL